MAVGDLTILEQGVYTGRGGRLYNVAAGTAILAGEPVYHVAVGDVVVQPMATTLPLVSASAGVEGKFVGVATTASTNTATAAGTVYVMPQSSAISYLIAPVTAASWDTQAEYDALVGKRLTINNSTTVGTSPQNVGTYALNASDSANNGVVVLAMNILEHPVKVAIAFRNGTSDLA